MDSAEAKVGVVELEAGMGTSALRGKTRDPLKKILQSPTYVCALWLRFAVWHAGQLGKSGSGRPVAARGSADLALRGVRTTGVAGSGGAGVTPGGEADTAASCEPSAPPGDRSDNAGSVGLAVLMAPVARPVAAAAAVVTTPPIATPIVEAAPRTSNARFRHCWAYAATCRSHSAVRQVRTYWSYSRFVGVRQSLQNV